MPSPEKPTVSTVGQVTELDSIRAEATSALRENADLLYRHELTFDDGTTVRCSVQDPNRTDRGAQLAVRLAQSVEDLEPLDLRLLRAHPDDLRPIQGARVDWQGGTLTVLAYSQVSDWTDTAVGICRWSAG